MEIVRLLTIVAIFFSGCESPRNKQIEIVDSTTALQDHPRILWLKGEEAGIGNKVSTDSTWKAVHGLIISECNNLLDKPLIENVIKTRRTLSQARECRKRIFYLSYAWRTTKDKRYLDRAERELLNVSGFEDWNPSHFLDVAEMTMAAAIGYDWLFNDLKKHTLFVLKQAIINKGIEPSLNSKYNWWLEADGNWNQVCNASMAWGALAIYEDAPELAMEVINRSIASVKRPMASYEPDGAFPEGYMYWGYGTTFNVYLISALEKAFDLDFGFTDKSGFLKTAGYLANMIGPTQQNFNYSDCGPNLTLNPAMFWFADRVKDHSLLYTESKILKNNLWAMRDLPALIIWGASVDMKNVSSPSDLIWTGRGSNPVALMRSSWKDDAIYVGVKGGKALVNGHSHLDVGSFVMDASGERWAMDFGGQEDYSLAERSGIDLWSRKQESERWKLFRYNNLAHNTLTFNNDFQLVEGYAPLLNYTNEKSFLSAVFDLSEVYKNHAARVIRGISIVDQEYVVIRDEIDQLKNESTIRWTMVTPSDVKIINRHTAELTQNGKKLYLKVLEPNEVSLFIWSTEPMNDFEDPNPGTRRIGFEVNFHLNSKSGITVLLMPDNDKLIDKTNIKSLEKWNSK